MSFVGNALNTVLGGVSGPLTNSNHYVSQGAATADQTKQAYEQTQTGLKQQQDFLNALQSQNGIQNQADVYAQLQGIANGTGPNPAQAALNQNTAANIASQGALQAGQRGASQNVGLMARNIGQQGANLQQQAAGQAATLQAQQQAGAINNMGNLATTQVGQQANAGQQYNQAALQQQQNLLGSVAAANQVNSEGAKQNAQARNDMVGGMLNGAGSALAMSDEHQKKNIRPADGKIEDFLSKAGAHEYEYKNSSLPGAGKGKHVSPMAQELEQSELGSQMVENTPNGKMVDYGKGFGTIVAAQADLHKRLAALEGKKAPVKMANGGGPILSPEQMAQQQALNSIQIPAYIQDQATGVPQAPSPSAPIPQAPESASMSTKGGYGVGTAMGKGIGKGLKSIFGGKSDAGSSMVAGGPMDAGGVSAVGGIPTEVAFKGAYIPGKAKVKGDNPKNDTVDAKLSPGEIVIPRSVVNSDDPSTNAAKFVAAILAGKGLRGGKR